VVEAVDVAPLAGRALRGIIASGHHTELFDTVLTAADRYLIEHYAELREQFEREAPRWVPDLAYRRVFDRLHARLRERLAAMAADPDDGTRRRFDQWIEDLPDRLETSPELRERAERLKRDALGSAVLRDWSLSLWQQAREALRAQAADPDSELRRRLAGALVAAGRRLASDRQLQDGVERMIESGTRTIADQFHDELAGLVTGTIERWDAAETSNQLELLLGRDLQYIRLNGTVVGAAVGLALHALALVLG
jgi:uncharacterized membrane-anchored protein YjiN (DUF445 family)